MQSEDIRITNGENDFQTASFEINDKTIDYETSRNLSYMEIISISKGLDAASEFYDVKAAISSTGAGICAVSLGKDIEEALKKKLEFVCSFCNTKCEIQKGSIRTIERTNLSFVEPHRIIIKGITFLAFNYETNIYIENLSNKIKIIELEQYLKSI